jgi:hypothetical protein
MNAAHRLFAAIGIALIVAVASFKDRLAIWIGDIGLIALAAIIAFAVIGGVSLSLWRRQQ